MRYLLALTLLAAACKRANPDLIPGNGGNGGGGAAGGGGVGGGGAAGGGGNGGGRDMAMSTPADMAKSPADMTSFVGVFCGSMTCIAPDSECCATQTLMCQSPNAGCNGAAFDCDGPEDCSNGDICCGGTGGSACTPLGGGGCQGGDVPLCHTLDDCPKTNGGFVACCPSPQGGHLHFCSKNTCP